MAKMVPYIPVGTLDELKEYARSAIVKLKHTTFPAKGKDGTAFFVRFKSETGEVCHGLMTNHHVLNFDHEDPIVEDGVIYEGKAPDPLTVSLSSEKLQFTEEMKLEEASVSYAFSCSRLDVTLLEFSEETVKRFTAKEVVFLEMERDVSASYGDCLHIYGHPGRGQLCKGEGRLVGQPTPLICYSIDTAPGFSGSPIFKVIMVDRRKNSFRYQLVGIHHRGGDKDKYNCGTPIETALRAFDRDRPIALQDERRQYPRKQKEDAEENLLIQHLFGVDLKVVTGLDPPIDRVSVFDHVKYYAKPRFYKINSGNVEMTLSHSLEWDQFTLMDVLDDRHIAVPWRDFSVDEFKAFHKLAMALQRLCLLERSEHTGTTILKSLEKHIQQILDKCSLAEYYCRANCRKKYQTDAIVKLKWAIMAKDGPEHLAHALLDARGIVTNKEQLKAKLDKFKSKDATEVELIETIANCLQLITSQLQTYGCPPAELKIHVQRVDAVAELGTLITKCLEDKEPDRKGRIHVFQHDAKTAAVSVWGMGGLGKTHLVLDVVRSAEIQKTFPNLIWHEVGQLTNAALVENMKGLADKIKADIGYDMPNNVQNIKCKLQEPQFKKTLLVIDNVWSSDVAKNFLFDFPTVFTSRVRLVFDTQQRIASYEIACGFTLRETTDVFEKSTENNSDTHQKAVEISEIQSFCGGHPLVIAILARNIAKKIQQGRNGWDVVTELKAGLKIVVLAKSESISEQRHRNVLSMLRAIMETMEVEDRNCLYALRICRRGAKLTRNALKALWIDFVEDPDDEADYLCNQALLQEEQQNVFIIHDVIFDFITKAKTTDADMDCHMKLIQNFERNICPLEQVAQQDFYMTTHCGYHLRKANLMERWVALFVHNIDFLEEVAEQGIDLEQELGSAVLQQFFENTDTAIITEVSQTLQKLMERHEENCDRKKREAQDAVTSQITQMLFKALFAFFQREEALTMERQRHHLRLTSDAKLLLYLMATNVAEKGMALIAALRRSAEPAEIQRLVDGMPLASFFQTEGDDGRYCIHAAMMHEQAAVVFDILKNAKVWNQQSMVITNEAIVELDAIKILKIAGSNTLLNLYNNYEKQLSSSTSTRQTKSLFDVLKIERPNDLLSKLANNIELNLETKSVAKIVLQSCVVQMHQFAMADKERWMNVKRIKHCADETSSIFGLLLSCALYGIQSTALTLCDNLVGGYKNDVSWKGLISAQSKTKLTALHIACYSGNPQIANKLINNSADICKETTENSTCLQMAAQEGHQDVVENLLTHLKNRTDKRGFEDHIDHQNCNGYTALHLACVKGHLQIVKKLIDNSANLLTETTENNTCLQLAAIQGHEDVVEILLNHLKKRTDKRGFEQHVNHHNCNGRTSLHLACFSGHLQIVNKLIDNAANLFRKTTENNTCLQMAAQEGHQGVVENLLSHLKKKTDKRSFEQHIDHQDCNGYTALHSACGFGHLQIVNKLIDNSANLLTETTENNTCLQLAAIQGHEDVVEILLNHLKKRTDKRGFEQHVNHHNCYGRTVLHIACYSGNLQIANKLINNSADICKETTENSTCLQLAAQEGHQDVVENLLTHLKNRTDKRGFEDHIDHHNCNGCTALHSACFSGHLKIVNKLIDNAANLFRETTKNNTCLQLAAQEGYQDVVENLLIHLKKKTDKRGFEEHINHQDCNGYTALHSACGFGHLQIVNKLIDNAANLLTETTKNNTCLQLAAQEGHQDVVENLLTQLKQRTDKRCFEQHVNHHNCYGRTALHSACFSGHLQIVNQLLGNSVDPLTLTDKHGITGLHLAAYEGHHDIAEVLVAHANNMGGQCLRKEVVDLRNNYGVTALQMAGNKGHITIVDTLLICSANYLNSDDDGDTCLQGAVINQQSATVLQLLKHVSDKNDQHELKQFIDHQNNKGRAALHQACNKSSVEIVSILLTYLADHFLQDIDGNTCLQNAILKGESAIVKCIVQHVKDCKGYKGQRTLNDLLNQKNNWGLTAFGLAFHLKQIEMVELLRDCLNS